MTCVHVLTSLITGVWSAWWSGLILTVVVEVELLRLRGLEVNHLPWACSSFSICRRFLCMRALVVHWEPCWWPQRVLTVVAEVLQVRL